MYVFRFIYVYMYLGNTRKSYIMKAALSSSLTFLR